MLLEETPSGNLRLSSPDNPEAAVKLTRGELRAAAGVFALLDRWDREAGEIPEERSVS